MSKTERVRKAGLISGTLLVLLGATHASGAVLAQVDPLTLSTAAKTAVDISQSNPFLGAIYIMAAITIGIMYFAWNQQKIVIKQSEDLSKLGSNLERLIDNLNIRPCIYDAKISNQQNKLDIDKP